MPTWVDSLNSTLRAVVPPKWALVIKVAPFIALLAGAKLLIDLVNADFITLTTLFGSIVAASVFLLGFLLAGTLTDYKESERLPGELASSIESLADECLITFKNKGTGEAQLAVSYISDFASAVHRWFYREERTRNIMDRISGMNDLFPNFEPLTQPNFIVRMKQEQSTIRKIVTRIDTIRDTSFVPAAYALAEMATVLLLMGLLFTEIEPFYEALFYVMILGFFTIYLVLLIKDLDDPFCYSAGETESGEVSIRPIADLDEKLKRQVAAMGALTAPNSAAR